MLGSGLAKSDGREGEGGSNGREGGGAAAAAIEPISTRKFNYSL
jgi:hypothetical protein